MSPADIYEYIFDWKLLFNLFTDQDDKKNTTHEIMILTENTYKN